MSKIEVTTSLDRLQKQVIDFSLLTLPDSSRKMLNSGAVLYVIRWDGNGSLCWPYFPIGKHRKIVKDLEKKGISVPSGVKVIVEINGREDADVKSYILDCIGHVILYLQSPKHSNECEDAIKIVKTLGIHLGNKQ